MGAVSAKAKPKSKSKPDKASAASSHTRSDAPPIYRQTMAPPGRLSAFYAAGPALSLGGPVQRQEEEPEEEAPQEPVQTQPVVQRKCAECEEEDAGSPVQTQPAVQRLCEECEEEDAGSPVQMQAGEPEEEEASQGVVQTQPAVQPECVDCEDEEAGGEADAVQSQEEEPEEQAPPEPVQEKGVPHAAPDPKAASPAAVHTAAARGLRSATRPLPNKERIQESFGRHDISDVQVQVAGPAEQANRHLRARAYTSGDRIAFKKDPDLHLAAHEAAHVVQQRHGVHLKGGIGEANDPYEQHANRVADAVVAGRSAESILDTHPQIAANGKAASSGGVQKACACGGAGCEACKGDREAGTAEESGAPQTTASGAGSVQMQLEVNATRRFEEAAGGEAAIAAAAGGGGEPAAETEGEGEAAPETEAEEGAEAEGESALEAAESAEGGGEEAGAEGGGEGAPAAGQEEACEGSPESASCYDEAIEEPAEEPDEEPQDPGATEAEEQMKSDSPEAEEEDDCPIEEAVETQAEGAAPAGGIAEGAGVGESSDGGGEATGAGGEADAAAEGGADAATDAGNDAGATTADAMASALSPIEASIGQAEGQRSEAVSAYGASSARLAGAGQRAAGLGSITFSAQGDLTPEDRQVQAATQKRADQFFSTAADRIEAAREQALTMVPERLGGLAESIKSGIAAGMESEKAAISSRIAAARAQAIGEAAAARQHVESEYAAIVATIEAETSTALITLTEENATAHEQIDTIETDGLSAVNDLYATSREAHEGLGVTIGAEAITRGQAYSDEYEKCKINEADSWYAGHLTDRRAEAQQNAAKETAKGYKKSLKDAAKTQAGEAMKGRQKDRCGVIAAGRRTRSSLDDQLDGLVATLESGREDALKQAGATRDGFLASIDANLAATLSTLDEQEHTQRQSVNDTGYLQQVAVEQAAHAAAASVQNGVAESIEGLEAGLVQVQGSLSGMPTPDPEMLSATLAGAEATLGAAMEGLQNQVEQGMAQSEASLMNTHAQAMAALVGVTQNNDECASELSSGFTESMATMTGEATTTFAQQRDGFVQKTQKTTTDGVAGFQQAVTGFQTSVTAITTSVESALKDSETRLEESLRQSLSSIDCEIPKKANEAASKEQPAWKTVVAVILIIAVIVVVALVIGPAVIGAVGAAASALGAGAAAGTIGTLVGGAIVGAMASATIQVINNWRTGEDLMTGVGRAAIMGAIGGFVGAGAGALVGRAFTTAAAQALSAGTRQVLQFAANVATDAVMDVSTQLITTGQFSWRDFGVSLAMSIATGGMGELKSVKRIQARMTYRGGRIVPGARARAHTERARISAEQDLGPLFGERPAAPTPTPRTADVPGGAPRPPAADTGTPTRPPAAADTGTPTRPSAAADTGTPTRPPTDADTGAPTRPPTAADAEPPRASSSDAQGPPSPKTKGHPDAPEIEPGTGVVAKSKTTDGREVSVLRDGRIIACNTCAEIRTKFSQELAENPQLRRQLDEIEQIRGPKAKSDAAAELRQRIEKLRAASGGVGDHVGGAELARLRGFDEPLPPGYHWRQEGGELIPVPNPAMAGNLVPVRYDPTSPSGVRPAFDPPSGYKWARNQDGSFRVDRAKGQTGKLPQIEYDPSTGGFKHRGPGGEPYVPAHLKGTKYADYDFNDPAKPPCFVPGTLVKAPDGDRAIESILPGDLVYAYDFRAGARIACPVLRTKQGETEHVVDLVAGGEVITATRRHHFWVEDAGAWMPAEALEGGMTLRRATGEFVTLEQATRRSLATKTHNLEVGGVHNYFVGGSGLLVHNDEVEHNFADLQPRNNHIYAIWQIKPKPPKIVYVGKTRQPSIHDRFKQHLQSKPHWSADTHQTRPLHSGSWTDFETALWEKHFIEQHGGLSRLENDVAPITEEKFKANRSLHENAGTIKC